MATCIVCDAALAPEEPPRFDVLADGYDADDPTDVRGPYCAEHFAETQTGRIASAPPAPAPVAPAPPSEVDLTVDVPSEDWET